MKNFCPKCNETKQNAGVRYLIEVESGCYDSGGKWDGFDDPEEDWDTQKILKVRCNDCGRDLVEPPDPA